MDTKILHKLFLLEKLGDKFDGKVSAAVDEMLESIKLPQFFRMPANNVHHFLLQHALFGAGFVD